LPLCDSLCNIEYLFSIPIHMPACLPACLCSFHCLIMGYNTTTLDCFSQQGGEKRDSDLAAGAVAVTSAGSAPYSCTNSPVTVPH
jgi:hypothetical protein